MDVRDIRGMETLPSSLSFLKGEKLPFPFQDKKFDTIATFSYVIFNFIIIFFIHLLFYIFIVIIIITVSLFACQRALVKVLDGIYAEVVGSS